MTKNIGKPCAGKPHARFDEGRLSSVPTGGHVVAACGEASRKVSVLDRLSASYSTLFSMLTPEETTARKIGRIDAALFFFLWAVVLLFSAAQPYGALPVIIFLLVPASALVGWRGAASVRLLLQGRASLLRGAIEGFAFACLFLMVVWLWSWFSHAHAAGTVFDSLSPESPDFWRVIGELGLWLLSLGVVGAIHGVLLLYLNYRLLMANPSFQRTVKKLRFLPPAEFKR